MVERAEEVNKEVFDSTLAELLAGGMDRRVAEGKARRAAMMAFNKAQGIDKTTPAAGGGTAAPAGDGGGAPTAAPAAAAVAPAAGGAPMAGAPVAVTAPAMATRTAPSPTGKAPTAAKAGAPDKHRLLALVPPEGVQRVEREQGDRVNTFPHLLTEELLSLLIVTTFLIVFSTFVNAPIRELANGNLTPNPSKAPWYFLGLQELLRYFHPMVAGVLFPTVYFGLLMVLPYADRNPSTKPGDRKMAIVLFTMLMMFFAITTIIGSFFRGPGFNFVWPWESGLFFDL